MTMSTAKRLIRRSSRICSRCSLQSQRREFVHRLYSTTSNSGPVVYDVVCVGGGPAGLGLLTALRSNPVTAGLRIALIEAQDLARTVSPPSTPTLFSNRCSSLTPASANFLHSIGAWQHMQRGRIQEYQEMQVWDGLTGARIEFDWHGSSGKSIAYMAENVNLTSGLLTRLRELGSVEIFDNARVERIGFGEETEEADLREWPVIHLAGGHSLTTRLLVGADGVNSPVRAFAGIQSRGWDYDRHGVVATLQLEGDGWGGEQRKIAYQRFLPTGPIAMLPLPGNLASLVWSTTPERAALLKRLGPKDFVAMVNAAFRLGAVDLAFMHDQSGGQTDELAWRLQHTAVEHDAVPQAVVGVQEGSVASFPLKLRHADTYVGERVALVGDAAHTIHPLAGQGLNQGQADVRSLADAISYAVSHGQDLGTQMWLEPYNAERYTANHVLMGVCDKLHKLYSVSSGPLVPLRSVGLKAVNALSPLKNFFMEQASGTGAKVL